MRSGIISASLALLLAVLTGCGPKKPVAVVSPPAPVQDLPPTRMAASLAPLPPPFPPVARRTVKLDTTAPPEAKPEVAAVQPHHPPKKHTRPAPDETAKNTPPPQSPAQITQDATAQPPDQTPLGQLSMANPTLNTGDRRSISDSIDSTENGVNSIKRSLNPDEQKTVALIRTYITRARDALKVDDLDGAKTMSDKAHQMLQELTKP